MILILKRETLEDENKVIGTVKLVSCIQYEGLFVCLMVFNATFNNISVISWQSVLLMEETGGGPGENHRPVASH